MNETPPLLPTATPQPSRSVLAPAIAILVSAAAASAVYYGYISQQQINQQILQQLATLQTTPPPAPVLTPEQLAALQSIPAMAEAVNKLPVALTEQSTAINARLETLEKNTTPTKSSPRDSKLLQQFLNLKLVINQGMPFADALGTLSSHPEITEGMTPLAEMAESGIKPESSLRNELRALVAGYHETNPVRTESSAAPHSLIARLNAQFNGMLHISKRGAVPENTVATLQMHIDANAPLSLLVQDIKSLSAAAQPYFNAWLNAAAARQKADHLLMELEAALANPAGAQ